MSEWKYLKIEDCADIIGGGTPSTNRPEYWDGDISWITPKDLSNYSSIYISKGNRSISNDGLKNSSARIIPKGAVLLTIRAPIGYLAIASEDLSTNQGFKSLVMKNNNIPEFFYYLLKHNKDKLLMYATGTTFLEINATTLKSLEFNIPPIKTQKRISEILSPLDGKIEINNKMNRLLEELAETIFHEWFVNFNFNNEEGKPYKKSGGKMVESELGDIPEGFRVGTISDLIKETLTGDWGKDKEENSYTEEVICIRGADIDNISSGGRGNPVNRFILEKNLKSKQLEVADIVIECSGGSPTQSTGRSLLITDKLLSSYNRPLICTNFCRVLKIENKKFSNFLYSMLWYLYKTDLFFLYENGTTGIKNLDINSLFNKYQIVIPSEEVLSSYNSIVNNSMNYVDNNRNENQKLAELRDTLLPKLMSGELKV